MNIIISYDERSNTHSAMDQDANICDAWGTGNSPDEAIGHLVRELYLSGDGPVVIDDISSEED